MAASFESGLGVTLIWSRCRPFIRYEFYLSHFIINYLRFKNLKTGAISVSKLCCPVCWDLLDIMSASSNHQSKPVFSVAGNHDTVYYVALPPIIPRDILNKMISRFRGYLCHLVQQLAQPANNTKTHRSTQSSSGASVASSVTKEGKEQQVFAGTDIAT